MSDAEHPRWAREESVEAMASAAFAYRYWISIENIEADAGVERVEMDGPFRDRPGLRGRTHLTGGGTTDGVVTEVEPDRRLVIEVEAPGSTLRFELRFEPRAGGGSLLTQRVSLYGPHADQHLADVEAGFGASLRDGMRAVRDRVDAAALRHAASSPGL